VRETLDVVRHVAGQLHDRRAQTGLGPETGAAKAAFDELGKPIRRNAIEAQDRPRFVERPLAPEHALHQGRLGAGEDVPDLALLLDRGAQRVLDFLKGNLSWAEIFNIPPQTLQRLAEFGFLQYRTGRYEDAERFFKVLTMLNWNNGAFHSMLGSVYQRQKRHAEAIAEYSQAIELNPDEGMSWTNRGELQLAHGWLKPARADLEQALKA